MHGLRTSSVLILDDNAKDALRIQQSLALRGIGAILVLGGPEDQLPAEAIKGIRVAVLDIHLGRATGSAGEVVSTKGIVNQMIARDNGPYVAVVWTANEADFETFKSHLQEIECPPVKTVQLSKDEVQNENHSQQDIANKILDAIDGVLADSPPLEFSNLWEQLVRSAANDTVVALQLHETSRDDESAAMAFLATLLKGEAGGALGSDQAAVRALLAALNPVHFDKVEEGSAQMAGELAAAVAPVRQTARDGAVQLDDEKRAHLNTAMHFDGGAEGLGAGHVYGLRDLEGLNLGPALPDPTRVRKSVLDKRHFGDDDRLSAIVESDLPVLLLEVSATCDHRQGRIGVARLIAGVAIPANRVGRGSSDRIMVRRGDRLREVGPLNLPLEAPLPDRSAVIVWDALHPVSVSADKISEVQPIGRLREPVVADIRSWLSYHISRPGYARA